MTAAAFSCDGSVLAVAADKVITLWDPDRNILVAVIGDSLEPITTLSFAGKSEYLVSASRGSISQVTVWSMSKLSASWSYRLHAEDITCSIKGSSLAVLARSKLSKSVESDKATTKGADGIILFFNAANPVPLATWSVSKANGGRLSFVQLSAKLDDEVAETKTIESLSYVNGAHEYVLLDPSGEQSNKLRISS